MGWRTVVVTKASKLDLRMGYMVMRDSESTLRVHLSEISVLILETTAVSLTAALLNELTKEKIKVIFCDEKQNPSFEVVPYYGCHDCSLKLRTQLQWNETAKQAVWTAIVTQKIKQQAKNLAFFELPEEQLLQKYIEEIEFNDVTNREGHAAKVYFNALFGKGFSRSETNFTNAALNYGYSILLSCINREIVCNGYLTQLGLFHDNMFNFYNLGCDLMEPFRPIVDRVVKLNDPQKFETEEKRILQAVLSEEFIVDGRTQTLLNAIKIYTKSVFDAIENADTSCLKFYKYEL
ncbi:MAG: type II CRISPR-associated endonuclease Cas1 [Clostridia bacterium]|nr:type II CRISPR-associated endonuclease Cas1 [Clostridia bacterium]